MAMAFPNGLQEYIPTVFDTYTAQVMVNDRRVQLGILTII